MSEIDYSVTWTKATIAATVKWTEAEGGDAVWHATFTDKESMKKFMQQPAVKVLQVKCTIDPHYVPELTEEDYADLFFASAESRPIEDVYGEAPVGRDTRFSLWRDDDAPPWFIDQ